MRDARDDLLAPRNACRGVRPAGGMVAGGIAFRGLCRRDPRAEHDVAAGRAGDCEPQARRERSISPRSSPSRRTTIENLVRPSGTFRQKARRLETFCRHVVTRWDGDLGAMLAQDGATAPRGTARHLGHRRGDGGRDHALRRASARLHRGCLHDADRPAVGPGVGGWHAARCPRPFHGCVTRRCGRCATCTPSSSLMQRHIAAPRHSVWAVRSLTVAPIGRSMPHEYGNPDDVSLRLDQCSRDEPLTALRRPRSGTGDDCPPRFRSLPVADALTTYLHGMIAATADLVCCYKPNLAFYLAHGAAGWNVLLRPPRRHSGTYPDAP